MKLILYITLDSANVINKRLDSPLELDINLKGDVNIINPELVLVGDFRKYNYAHIPDLNRYYIINYIEQLNLRMCKISLLCDVLESYKNIILNSESVFNRAIKEGDYYNGNIDYSENEVVTVIDSGVIIVGEPTPILSTKGVL